MEYLNKEIFLAINSFAGENTVFDKVISIIAEGSPFIFVILIIFLFLNKKKREISMLSTYSAIFSIGINYLISFVYFHPRPFMDTLGTQLVLHEAENSFPSDTTSFMASIAFVLIFFKKTRTIGVIFLSISFIGGLARVYTAVHYPFDVIGSLFISFMVAITIYCLRNKLSLISGFILIKNK